ncbi:DUF1569 domain-containing protein [Chitinophaga varians]|uniref:DUF1569 domain-containing protein n=1 Tax=Chitinophaga varians TaxID=2202339 RepID=UPI00165FD6A8|nr:DUF1569 domain-containing protein [Chitinophaga varians]MBC9913807.1 DUF1569 domain-containing protein [Chitinophaga varians]
MKTLLDPVVREEIIRRINALPPDASPEWGHMTLYQMLKHCRLWEEMALGHKTYKRKLISFLFGKTILKQILKDEKPMMRGASTVAAMKITGPDGDISEEKTKWITLLQSYAQAAVQSVNHPFFGKMTRDQMGQLAYKHIDHHLRQFRG